MNRALYFNVIGKARNAFTSGKPLPLSFRLEQLEALLSLLRENRGEIVNALYRDLRKPRTEALVSEFEVIENETTSMIKNLKKYAETEALPMNLLCPTDRGYIRKEPYGVVLVIGAWNFPFMLTLMPLVGAMAAGNTVVIKPSEISAFSANTLAQLIPQYLDRDCYHVVLGDAEETQSLLKHKFDYIFFTGSPAVGKHVLSAAAPHLTPVTLELGGKNPCYIDDSANIEKATRRILWGKFLNAGQACVSVDYVLCSPSVCEQFLRQAYQLINEWHGSTARSCPNLARIVNGKHVLRLSNLLEATRGRIILGGNYNQRELWIEPTVVIDVEPNDPLMEDEIFGPILPIVTVNSVDDAIAIIRSKPTPLALYTFAGTDEINERIVRGTQSGGVCINDVVLQSCWPMLPFGGCGTAGIGAYHWKYSFDTFTHRRSVLHRGLSYVSEKVMETRYPPYTAAKTRWLSFGLKHFDKFFVNQNKLYKFLLLISTVTFYLALRRLVNFTKLREVLNTIKTALIRKLR